MVNGDATLMYSFPQWHPLSQQSPVPNGHRIQINRKKHRRRRKKTCFCYSSHLGSRSACNTIIALSLFFILIVVIAIAAVAIYIGMEIILDGSLRVTQGDHYSAELYNRSSQFFLTKAHTYKSMIEKVFARSILGPSIKQCTVMGFKNGSLVVFYRLILDRRKIPSRTYAILEETARKILFDEITTLKPTVFNNVRLDPKQIIVKKHSFHTEPAPHTDPAPEPPVDEAVVANLNPFGVLRRPAVAPPSIVRRRPNATSAAPATAASSAVAAARPRTTGTKKPHRQPTVERTSKIKLQLGAHSTTPYGSGVPPFRAVDARKSQTPDAKAGANRYSFVSEDDADPVEVRAHAESGAAGQNGAGVRGLGEAEVILVPATGEENVGGGSAGGAIESPNSAGAGTNAAAAAGDRRENRFGVPARGRNSTATIQKLPNPPKHQRDESAASAAQSFPASAPDAPPQPVVANLTNIPTRSNIGLARPLRPKPTLEKVAQRTPDKGGTRAPPEKAIAPFAREAAAAQAHITTKTAQTTFGREKTAPPSTQNRTTTTTTTTQFVEEKVIAQTAPDIGAVQHGRDVVQKQSTRNNAVAQQTQEKVIALSVHDTGVGVAQFAPDKVFAQSANEKVTQPPVPEKGKVREKSTPQLEDAAHSTPHKIAQSELDNADQLIRTENEGSAADSSHETDTGQSTEANSVIVLNTEVVTSTSVQVSYGQSNVEENEENTNSTDARVEEEPAEITHNLPSMMDLRGLHGGGSSQGQIKYKNIFPRSIRDVAKYEKVEPTSLTKGKFNGQEFGAIVEKYKKQPSNETLNLIIEHLASIYTKSTTQATALTTARTQRPNFAGLLLTRPMHRISTSRPATTETPKVQSICGLDSTKECANGQCILEHLWCNQFADCTDGSDEKNCTCTDYLKAQFWHKKICDGIVDCWDFSDENRCDWCDPDKFVCANAKLCIDQQKVCDGIRDCPTGDDEKNCLTISPFQTTNNDITYYSTGIMTVRRAGIWGKLCHEKNTNDSAEFGMQKLNELGKAICKIMTFKHFKDIKIINDETDKDHRTSGYYRLTQITKNSTSAFRRKNFKFVKTNCKNKKVIQVTCSGLECGIQSQIGKSRARGKYRGDRQSRIVGGGNATPGAWPWQAALYKEGEYQCGATLISKKWLLSAGHCFNNALHDYWVARLGILRRSSTLPSPHEQIHPIRRIIVHPQYVDVGFINDISLLEMNAEVQFTNFVRPICLPNPSRILLDNTMCTVIGWGQLMESGRVYPDALQEVQVPVISPAECHKRTMFLPLYKITDGMLCAGFERGGRDACHGDSGGPLMCQSNGDTWHLHGVTSNGNGCARAHRPGVYTKVANYMNWIDSHLKTAAKTNLTKTVHVPANCSGHRCPLGECLPKARICNGFMECSDGSDERGC